MGRRIAAKRGETNSEARFCEIRCRFVILSDLLLFFKQIAYGDLPRSFHFLLCKQNKELEIYFAIPIDLQIYSYKRSDHGYCHEQLPYISTYKTTF